MNANSGAVFLNIRTSESFTDETEFLVHCDHHRIGFENFAVELFQAELPEGHVEHLEFSTHANSFSSGTLLDVKRPISFAVESIYGIEGCQSNGYFIPKYDKDSSLRVFLK